MAIKALDLAEVIKYTLESDTEDPKTVWHLGVLDTRIRKQLEDISWEYEAKPGAPEDATAKAFFNIGKSELEFVAFGLKGFDNFLKPDGHAVYFKTEQRIVGGKVYHVLSEDILKIIPGDTIKVLADKIKEINSVTDTERKNS